MLETCVLLIIGIILLIKGADIFVDSGSNIAKLFKISEILLGLTFVAFGTSLPELIIGINASNEGSYGIVIGNIIGTNIVNMAGILALICIINPIKFLRETVKKDMYMSLLSSIILFVLLLDTFGTTLTENVLSRTDGIIMLLFFAIFIYYTIYAYQEYKREKNKNKDITKNESEIKIKYKDLKKLFKNLFFMILGLALVLIGSDLVVDSAAEIALQLNFSQTFIAIIIIAIGTSLPEISTSIIALKKNKGNLAVGNLIGSNMFNTLFILGTSALVSPIVLPMNTLLFDCIIYIAICSIIILFSKSKFELGKKEGFCLLSIYILYLIYVIHRL